MAQATYSDYLTKISMGFVCLAEKFSNQVNLGMRDCCLEQKLQVLWTQVELFPKVYNETCDYADMIYTMEFINTLINYYDIDSISDTPVVPIIDTEPVPIYTPVDYCAGIESLGPMPVYVPFKKDGVAVTLGVDGQSYALTFSAYNYDDEIVDVLITNRTKYGFVVRNLDIGEGNITFEWSAILKH
jgi:hypothetical protein